MLSKEQKFEDAAQYRDQERQTQQELDEKNKKLEKQN